MVVYSGRTVEQAIEKGLKDLNLPPYEGSY